jgi:hypothetical protein
MTLSIVQLKYFGTSCDEYSNYIMKSVSSLPEVNYIVVL